MKLALEALHHNVQQSRDKLFVIAQREENKEKKTWHVVQADAEETTNSASSQNKRPVPLQVVVQETERLQRSQQRRCDS